MNFVGERGRVEKGNVDWLIGCGVDVAKVGVVRLNSGEIDESCVKCFFGRQRIFWRGCVCDDCG